MVLRIAPALALAALLAMGGLAAAGREGPDPGTSDDSGSPDGTAPPDCSRAKDPEACKAVECHDRPEDSDDSRCPAKGNGSKPGGMERRGESRTDRLEHIGYTVESPTAIAAFTVDGWLTLDRITLSEGGAAAAERKGNILVVGDGDSRLRLHDTPVGHVEFKGGDGSVRLAFPAGVEVTVGETGRATRIHYPDGRDALLVADAAIWDGRNATLTGFFSFHVARGAGPFGDGPGDGELRPQLRSAVEKRRLGAEVALERNPANASRAVQVMAYDDLSVQVSLPDTPTPGVPIAVRLAANLSEGRTVALRVDPALLANSTADRLELRYFDDHDDGTRTEVLFLRAASLADALDPTDDAGQPEYWVVSDADGLQVLVSVPHWSVHTVTLAGLGALVQPSVLLGLVAGAAGTAVAAVAMFWPRRRE